MVRLKFIVVIMVVVKVSEDLQVVVSQNVVYTPWHRSIAMLEGPAINSQKENRKYRFQEVKERFTGHVQMAGIALNRYGQVALTISIASPSILTTISKAEPLKLHLSIGEIKCLQVITQDGVCNNYAKRFYPCLGCLERNRNQKLRRIIP